MDFSDLNENKSDDHNSEPLFPSTSRIFRGNHKWGVYEWKPVAQDAFEQQVAAASVTAAAVQVQADVRPRAFDYNSGTWFLLDSGAAISCLPRQPSDIHPDKNRALKAVNGATIDTFGTRTLKLNFGARTYTHTFIVASISEAILGWNFMLDFKLGVSWNGDKCELQDSKARKNIPLKLQQVEQNQLNLATLNSN